MDYKLKKLFLKIENCNIISKEYILDKEKKKLYEGNLYEGIKKKNLIIIDFNKKVSVENIKNKKILKCNYKEANTDNTVIPSQIIDTIKLEKERVIEDNKHGKNQGLKF